MGKNMKRLYALSRFIIMGLFSLILCSFTTTTFTDTENNIEMTVSVPIYWEGWATYCPRGSYRPCDRIYITVYQNQYSCNSFTAIASKFEDNSGIRKTYNINKELVVKGSNGEYYVTYNGKNYQFNM